MEEKSTKSSDYLFVPMSSKNLNRECMEEQNKNEELTGIQRWFSENLVLLSTLLAVGLGCLIGFGLRPLNLSDENKLLVSYPGELFMRILKLMILPLIISSLIAGSASLNSRLSGKIAIRTLLYFLITSFINAILGVLLAVTLHPGGPNSTISLEDNKTSNKTSSALDSILDLGRNIFADNLFQTTFQQTHTKYINKTIIAFNSENGDYKTEFKIERVLDQRNGTNTLGIVFFCLVFGTILGSMGDKAKPVIDFFSVVFQVIMKMIVGVIWLTPVGICSVIAGKILSVEDIALMITQLSWFVTTMIIGVFIYQLFIMQFIYFVIVRKNPFKLYWSLIEATLTAFATASTAAALPITFTIMEKRVRIDPRILRFVLPIGCNINMDGTALFIAVASIFIAQMHQIPIDFGKMLTVCFTSTAASFSSASVPSAAVVLLMVVLSAIDAPTDNVTLLFAIDWLVDRFRTTNNMLGDCYAAAVVEKLSIQELIDCDPIYETSSIGINIRNEQEILNPSEVGVNRLLNEEIN